MTAAKPDMPETLPSRLSAVAPSFKEAGASCLVTA
jgi:hypothetical protein